jgi:hypothetical protein
MAPIELQILLLFLIKPTISVFLIGLKSPIFILYLFSVKLFPVKLFPVQLVSVQFSVNNS